MRLALTFALVVLPSGLFAAAGMDFDPPQPTETTKTCAEGLIWDPETESCVAPADATKEDAALRKDVRELAYAGRYADAALVLDALPAQDSFVLTYRGFIARKTGDMGAATRYYRAALEADPDNLLARSYMGQGLVEAGDRDGARAQLTQIRQRGGRDTWPEVSLRLALQRGAGFSY